MSCKSRYDNPNAWRFYDGLIEKLNNQIDKKNERINDLEIELAQAYEKIRSLEASVRFLTKDYEEDD